MENLGQGAGAVAQEEQSLVRMSTCTRNALIPILPEKKSLRFFCRIRRVEFKFPKAFLNSGWHSASLQSKWMRFYMVSQIHIFQILRFCGTDYGDFQAEFSMGMW